MRARLSTLVMSLATALAPVSASQAEPPAIREGTPYYKVRAILMANGFMPIRPDFPDDLTSTAYVGIIRVFPELFLCAGTGRNYCIYLYKEISTGRHFEVITYGEPDGFDLSGLRYNGISRADVYVLRDAFTPPRFRPTF